MPLLAKFYPWGLLLLLLVLLIAYLLPLFAFGLPAHRPSIVLYGFSILEEPITEGILPAFQRSWKQKTGQEVEFYTSFGGSGTIANLIRFGAPAEVAIFSHNWDADKLKQAGLIQTDWTQFPHHGVVNRTPIVLVVRPGNPKRIHNFDDLTQLGVRIIHPDPQTSGAAYWSILAEYGAFLLSRNPPDPIDAQDKLSRLWRNIAIFGSSASASWRQFDIGFGDVLVTYEQQAVRNFGRGLSADEIVAPTCTVYAEHPAVMFDRNIPQAKRPLISAFLEFLWTDEAQRIFVKFGFRSVSTELNGANPHFLHLSSPLTIADLGGWPNAYHGIIEDVWEKKIIEKDETVVGTGLRSGLHPVPGCEARGDPANSRRPDS